MKLDEFTKLMAIINVNFETKATTKEAMLVWFEYLKHLDYNKAAQAVNKLIVSHDSRFVVIKDILTAVEQIDNPKTLFIDAYESVNYMVRNFGRYKQQEGLEYMDKTNPAMARVVRAIGYSTLCNVDQQYTRAPIERMYKEVKVNGESANLIGMFSSEINEIRYLALPKGE